MAEVGRNGRRGCHIQYFRRLHSKHLTHIFHLASLASPIDHLDLPIQTLKVGALGTYNMLGLTKEQGARFLLASTSEVYGDPLVNLQPESYSGNVNPIGPRGVR